MNRPLVMNLNNSLTAIGQIAIIASLIFVGFQIQQDQDISESEILALEADLELSFSQLVSLYPIAWTKGLAGEQLTEEEKVQFDAMAYTLFRIHANRSRRGLVFDGRTIGGSGDQDKKSYALFIHENKGYKDWYRQLLNARLERDMVFGDPEEICCYPSTLTDYLEHLETNFPDMDQNPNRRLQTY